MSDLNGKKVAVLVETEYIPSEVEYYRSFFEKQGAEVEFMTYLWGKPHMRTLNKKEEIWYNGDMGKDEMSLIYEMMPTGWKEAAKETGRW